MGNYCHFPLHRTSSSIDYIWFFIMHDFECA
jgi:hypothetical protein